MWTSEFLADRTVITLLDDTGEVADVSVTLHEHGSVYIEQYDVDIPALSNWVEIPRKMFAEFLQALNSPEGAFRISSSDKA